MKRGAWTVIALALVVLGVAVVARYDVVECSRAYVRPTLNAAPVPAGDLSCVVLDRWTGSIAVEAP